MSAESHETSPFAGLDAPSNPAAEPLAQESAFANLGAAPAEAAHRPTPGRTSPRRLPWTWKLLIVLVPYTTLLTAYTVYLLQNRPPHPLEQMGDQGLYEDYLDGKRKLTPQTLDEAAGTKPAQEGVDPAIELVTVPTVGLGQTRRYGAIEVTPLRVTRGRWTFAYKNATTDLESLAEGLILTLRVKNVSETIFAPHDPTFNRAKGKHLVYTYLTVGQETYYGPISDPVRERIKGQDFAEFLPGEARETLIIAAPQPGPHGDLLAELDKLPKETLLTWRVHLRRGQEKLKGGKKDRAVWVTAVVPVQFRLSDIQAAPQGK